MLSSTTEPTRSPSKIGNKRVFTFSDAYKAFDGNRDEMKELLGGKGAGLAEMTASGVKVPPGITMLTSCCREYSAAKKMPDGLFDEVLTELKKVETELGKTLGSLDNPLLLSVRSGAKFSMPGMMDTILNLGMNDKTVDVIAEKTGNARFAWDSYRRFIHMYSNVVLNIDKEEFEDILAEKKKEAGVNNDSDLNVVQLKDLVQKYKKLVLDESNSPFPQDVHEQLKGAIEAVFKSWNNPRAVYYRNLHKIDHNLGTAVNIQAMVFGNYDNN